MAIVADKSGNNPTDVSWRTRNRTNAGTPQAALTPQYIGERVFDTTNGVLYEAMGTSATSWAVVTRIMAT